MILTQKTKINIILPSDPTSPERFAAEELARYLGKVIKASSVIRSEKDEKADFMILVGAPSRNGYTSEYISDADFRAVCPGPEGIYIKSPDDSVLIVAGTDDFNHRGVVYAVYELLERYCGCVLAAFTTPEVPGGEIIPELDEVSFDNIEYIKPCCDLIQRAGVVQYEDPNGNPDRSLNNDFLDWLCKNRYNLIYTWSSIYEKMGKNGFREEAMRRGMQFGVGLHEATTLFLPPRGNAYFPEHYYETHPEFYRLQEDGTRYEAVNEWGQWILCSRNEEMIRTLAENMKSWLRKNTQVKEVLFNPNDGFAKQCCCEACSKYSKTENYLYVCNSVARIVREEFPEIMIQISAYVDIFDCPDDAVIDDCIIVEEATWHESGLRTCGKPDGTSLIGTFFEDNLIKWHEHGAQVRYYDYYMGVYQGRQRYLPMADEIQALTTRMNKLGFAGWCTQIELFNMWNNIFNFYCFGHSSYDISLSMEDNLERFKKLFGEGADDVAEIIRYAESVLDGQCEIMTAGIWLMNNIDKEKVYKLYDSALSKTTSPACRNNIRLMRMAFRYSDIETSLPEAATTNKGYDSVTEYTEPTGELDLMTEFDTYYANDPGYGIAIPARSKIKATFEKNIWYLFDK